jgi:hypothetical protein
MYASLSVYRKGTGSLDWRPEWKGTLCLVRQSPPRQCGDSALNAKIALETRGELNPERARWGRSGSRDQRAEL